MKRNVYREVPNNNRLSFAHCVQKMNRPPLRPSGSSTVVGLLLMFIVGLCLFAATPSSAKPRQSFFSGKIQCLLLLMPKASGGTTQSAIAVRWRQYRLHASRISVSRYDCVASFCRIADVCDLPSQVHHTIAVLSV